MQLTFWDDAGMSEAPFTSRIIKYCRLVKASQESLGDWKKQGAKSS